jgi:hypothetical protein
MRLSSGRRTSRLMPSSLNETGARRPIFSRIEITGSPFGREPHRFALALGLNVVSRIVKLHNFQLKIATRSRLPG